MNDKFSGGNLYPKFTTRNPVAKFLVNNYISSLIKLLGEIKFNSALDVGCGKGEIISKLKKLYPEVMIIGIDIDEEILAKAKQNNKGIVFEVQNIYKMSISDHTFDLVLCLEVLEHLSEPKQALKEIVRVSKKYILCSVPLEPVWSFLNLCRFAYIKNLGNTPGHVQKWTKNSFIELLTDFVEIKHVVTPLPWIIVLSEIKNV